MRGALARRIYVGDYKWIGLPRYVAVQVSAARWVIAELAFDPDSGADGASAPNYFTVTKPLRMIDAHARLAQLQHRHKLEERGRGRERIPEKSPKVPSQNDPGRV
jgi:hypothetical protein